MNGDANLHALTGAYALDALEPAERADFEAHLARCAECAEEVAGLRETAARLAGAARLAPPAALRERVLAQVALTPQVAPAAGVPAEPAAVPGGPAVASGPPGATAATGWSSAAAPVGLAAGDEASAGFGAPARAGGRRVPARRPTWWGWAAAAAAVVLVVGGVLGGSLAVRQHRADQALATAQAHMMVIATAPDAVSHEVALGTSHVVMSHAMSAAALVGEDVPMPGESGMTYQLWMVHADGSTAPGPTFVPDRGRVLAFVEGDLAAVTALTVTEEPTGGSSAPTGPLVASVAL